MNSKTKMTVYSSMQKVTSVCDSQLVAQRHTSVHNKSTRLHKAAIPKITVNLELTRWKMPKQKTVTDRSLIQGRCKRASRTTLNLFCSKSFCSVATWLEQSISAWNLREGQTLFLVLTKIADLVKAPTTAKLLWYY